MMKFVSALLFGLLLYAAPASAQNPPLVKPCVQTSPTTCPPVSSTTPLPISSPDGLAVAGTPLTGTGTLISIPDTTGYLSGAFQITSAGVGATVTYQESNDGSAWASVSCYPPNAGPNTTLASTSTTVTQLTCPFSAKQFRAQVTGYASGTVNGNAFLRKDPATRAPTTQIGISSNANGIGGYGSDLNACSSGCSINTLTIAASSHASGSAVGGLQTFPYFRTAGNSGIVNNVDWKWLTGTNLTAVTVYLFNANPSTSTCTDAVALSISAADAKKLVKGSPFVLSPAVIGTGSTFSVGAQQLPMQVNNGESSTSLYACVTVNTTVTPAANDGVLGVAGLTN